MRNKVDRYLLGFDTSKLQSESYDVLIIGSGIGGLYTALQLPEHLKVLVVSKESYDHTNSYKAQGGIACVMNDEVDSVEKHIEDTMRCGHYENDEEAVHILITEAREHIDRLVAYGVNFDKNVSGQYNLGMEGAHSEKRILHRGDTTGAHIMDVLYENCVLRSNIHLKNDVYVLDLLTEDSICYGALVKQSDEIKAIYVAHTILASGGIGRVLNYTTNDKVATGDGIGMAIRAGVELGDMNYLQYHPTVFAASKDKQDPFLISEAVRGEGAIIRDVDGSLLMADKHPLGDLAPRDIVSKTIFESLEKHNAKHVFLDMRHFKVGYMKKRFPYIYNKCLEHGFNPEEDLLPIAPMMHYHMGGIKVDLKAKTSIDCLYAIGECSNTGVHGKNRLASNSLLEAIVFGARAAEDISQRDNIIERLDISYTQTRPMKNELDTLYKISHLLNHYFVTKRKKVFRQLIRQVKAHESMVNVPSYKRRNLELYNMYCTTKAICEFEKAALELSEKESYVTKAISG